MQGTESERRSQSIRGAQGLSVQSESLQPVLGELLTSLRTDILCPPGNPRLADRDYVVFIQGYTGEGSGWDLTMIFKQELLHGVLAFSAGCRWEVIATDTAGGPMVFAHMHLIPSLGDADFAEPLDQMTRLAALKGKIVLMGDVNTHSSRASARTLHEARSCTAPRVGYDAGGEQADLDEQQIAGAVGLHLRYGL